MDLLQLHYFCTVARNEHMTNSAKELKVAQPSLSAMIAKLEKDLGTPLFHRQGRNIKLNHYGRKFLRYAEQSLLALEKGRLEVEEMAGLEKGIVSFVAYSLPRFRDLLRGFLVRYPNVQFRILQEGRMDHRVSLLEQGAVDFYMAYPPVTKEGISGHLLLTESLKLAVPKSHKLAGRGSIKLEEAKDELFIGLKKGTSAREIQDGFCREVGFSPRLVCEMDEPAAISSLVSAGVGVAFLPPQNVDRNQDAFELLEITEPACVRTLYLAWMENRFLSKAARAFREYTIDYFSNEARRKF
ncbi:DNA-binding transcriptional regulator, LysR family [Seinonella peptonophila]|uniref:DNA-binding transcriptional regulator, LysR family n=1 Tax=Seinonella peptonophila TaxID=112248 RepID=A0A1M4WPA5_9BACL|nr:LysR family transcriptional regulator [Seinonella peptonophila]SHE82883.1 DNA-binding transcriptional regulator, LysR family [Seinonella peptonophila]